MKVWSTTSALGLALWGLMGAMAPTAEARKPDPLPPTSQSIEVVGFSPSGREVILRVDDENQGVIFQVRDAKKNRVLGHHPAHPDEKRVLRRLRDKYQVLEDHKLSSKNPRNDYVLMTEADDGAVLIYIREGERVRLYERLRTLRTRRGPPATAFVKQAVWGPKGKHVVVVYRQKVKDLLEWEGDFIHAFKFRSYRLESGEP